jgi:hypothetical protein
MKRLVCQLLALALYSCIPLVGFSGNLSSNGQPLFVENKGQFVGSDGNLQPDLLFRADIGKAQVYLSRQGLSIVLVSQDVSPQPFEDMEGEAAEKMRMLQAVLKLERMDMHFVGANPNVEVLKSDAGNSVEHYYLGHCPDGVTNVQSFGDITYRNLYPGIDWHISLKDAGFKTEFIVHAGADPSQIRISLSGAQDVQIKPDGSFEMQGQSGTVEDAAPTALQNGIAVAVNYVLQGNTLQYAVSNYDHNAELVIDPYTRVYSTYFGGAVNEWYLGHVTTTDLVGNMYLGGHSSSTPFPTTAGMFQTALSGSNDCFLAKFDNNGARLWCTYYGGSSSEGGIAFKAGLCIDPSNNVWMASVTSSTNFPVTAGCFQNANNGAADACLFKMDPAGTRLYATYYGGNGSESPGISRWGANSAPAIASDVSGNIFMTGLSQSTNLPVTAGCFQAASAGGTDAYLVKWSNAGARLYATYYGGTSNEETAAVGIAVDPSGNAWMTGSTASSNFPTTAGAFQTGFGGLYDQYLVKWNNACVRQYSTLYGGSDDEGILCDVDVTASGEVWMGVFTASTNFPVTVGANQTANAGGWENGLVRFSNAGARLYASYYGSSAQEEPWDIAVERVTGNVVMVGCTWGSVYPTVGPPFQGSSAGSQDAAIVVFNPAGAPIYSTYYGSNGHDEAFSAVFDINQNLWVAGMAANSSFPFTAGAFQTASAGGTDGFLSKWTPPVVLDATDIDFHLVGQVGNEVNLAWSYADEAMVQKYVLERDLGGHWETLYDDPSQSVMHTFTDHLPYEGSVYYRLRLDMKDGSTLYSMMLNVNLAIEKDRLIAAYPNPVASGEEVLLRWQMKTGGNVQIVATNLAGQQVYQKEIDAAGGRQNIDFSTKGWASGLYLVSLKSAHGSETFKLVVE